MKNSASFIQVNCNALEARRGLYFHTFVGTLSKFEMHFCMGIYKWKRYKLCGLGCRELWDDSYTHHIPQAFFTVTFTWGRRTRQSERRRLPGVVGCVFNPWVRRVHEADPTTTCRRTETWTTRPFGRTPSCPFLHGPLRPVSSPSVSGTVKNCELQEPR